MTELINKGDRLLARLRLIGWGGAFVLILTPLVLMQAAPQTGFNWTWRDFIVATAVIGGTGVLLDIALRISSSWSYRFGAAAGLGTSVLLLWSNLAVGYIGSEDNPFNLVFFGVVIIAFTGAVLSHRRPRGLSITMMVTAAAHGIVGAFGFPSDTKTGVITLVFIAMWLSSAAFFYIAARKEAGA